MVKDIFNGFEMFLMSKSGALNNNNNNNNCEKNPQIKISFNFFLVFLKNILSNMWKFAKEKHFVWLMRP